MADINDALYLYLSGSISESDSQSLFIQGHSAVNSFTSLYMQGMVPVDEDIPLYIDGVRTLFIEGRGHRLSDQLNLMVFNEQISESLPLYIRAPGFWSGWVPYGQGAPLYLRQDGVSIESPLYCVGHSEHNTYAPLYITNFEEISEGLTLVIPNVVSEPVNSFMSMYVLGSETTYGDWSAFIRGLMSNNSDMPLYLHQGNAELNTYTSLYVFGAHIENNNMTLTIPNVVDTLTYNSSCYIFGW
jgi:hypothetical protein